jgi:hypothetical protein
MTSVSAMRLAVLAVASAIAVSSCTTMNDDEACRSDGWRPEAWGYAECRQEKDSDHLRLAPSRYFGSYFGTP